MLTEHQQNTQRSWMSRAVDHIIISRHLEYVVSDRSLRWMATEVFAGFSVQHRVAEQTMGLKEFDDDNDGCGMH